MNNPQITHGLTGNLYITAPTPIKIVPILHAISKSTNSIYYNHKHQTFAVRIKSKSHKKKLKQLFSYLFKVK